MSILNSFVRIDEQILTWLVLFHTEGTNQFTIKTVLIQYQWIIGSLPNFFVNLYILGRRSNPKSAIHYVSNGHIEWDPLENAITNRTGGQMLNTIRPTTPMNSTIHAHSYLYGFWKSLLELGRNHESPLALHLLRKVFYS